MSSIHQTGYFGRDALLPFEMRAAQRRESSVEIEVKFQIFDTLPRKMMGGGHKYEI